MNKTEYYFCTNSGKYYGRIFKCENRFGDNGHGPGLIDGKVKEDCLFHVGEGSYCREATPEEILYAKLMGL